jgi:HlyD family secretion protein
MTKRGKTFLILGIVLVLALPVALRVTRGGEVKQVEMQKVGKKVISPTILASGALTYQTEIRMVSEIMGRVKELRVKEGDLVKQGDLLLRLDPTATQAEVAQLEAVTQQSRLAIQRQQVQLDTIETKWKRYQQLRDQGMIDANTYDDVRSQHDLARVELDSTRSSLQQSEAQLKRSNDNLSKTELRAPISGRVTALTIKVGETAVPSVTSIAGSDLMVVADTTNLYAEVNVNETDVARVNPGQKARIVPAAFPDKSWIGIVETVAVSPRTIVGQGKSYPVKIRLADAKDLQFHTGMSCRAEIVTVSGNTDPTLAVPVQALQYEETNDKNGTTKTKIFEVSGGRVHEKLIETATADDAYIQVTKGIAEGAQIATGPSRVLRFLRDGDRVSELAAPAENKTDDVAKTAKP